MKKTTVYFRADGNTQIGLGHLVRCIALAQMLHDSFKIIFVCRDIPTEMVNELRKHAFVLSQIENESFFFSEVSRHDIVVLDGYDFDLDYQKRIKLTGCKLVCVDDLHDQEFLADLIINHAPGVSANDYRAQPNTQFALGPEFVLLRPAFLQHSHKRTKYANENKTILICFGGLDHENLSLITLKAVLDYAELKKIILITGPSYQYFNTIESIVKKDDRIEYYHAIDEEKMVELMHLTDIAIVPASGILLESLAIGPIVISGMYTENQRLIFERYNNSGSFISAGNFSYDEIYKAVKTSLSLENKNSSIFDGLSGRRIREKFFALILTLREASGDDCTLLFKWVNDNSVRANAINKEKISWEKHKLWYASKLNSIDTFLYILSLSDTPIGQVRFEQKEDFWTIDYSIDKDYRNQGFGKAIIEKSFKKLAGKTLKAYVLPDNFASTKVFTSLGFIKKENEVINNVLCNVYQLCL